MLFLRSVSFTSHQLMDNTQSNAAKLRKLANTSIKIIVAVLGLVFLTYKLVGNEKLSDTIPVLSQSFHSTRNILLIAAAVLLMPLNLLIESRKWQLLVRKIEHVRLGRVLTAVMSGILASMCLPNRTGESLGRIFILEQGNRLKALMASIVGNIAQLMCTLVFGLIAVCVGFPFFYNIGTDIPDWMYWSMCVILAGTAACLIICYFNIRILCRLRFLVPKKYRGKADYCIEVFKQFDSSELAHILLLSALRYLTFSFQYVLLIWAFGMPLNYFEAMLLIMLTYLFLALIPIITIAEPAIRGSVSIYIFELWFAVKGLNVAAMSIFAASTLLWVINLVIPALLGLLFVYRLKFVRDK